MCVFFFFKQKTAYEMRISDWSSDVCSSDLRSGISDKNGYFTLDALNPQKDPNWKKAYNNYAPGADYQYCNLNFNLAGAILEKYSGERLDHYRSEEHTSELQSLMRISYAVFCLKKKKIQIGVYVTER